MDINFAESEEHVLSFDYASLELVQQQHIQQKTVEIKERLRCSAQDIWEIGQRLVAVRSHLKHGQFDNWLKAEFGWSRRTAYNFISIYETFDKSATVAQMNATTSALYLMAAPSLSPYPPLPGDQLRKSSRLYPELPRYRTMFRGGTS